MGWFSRQEAAPVNGVPVESTESRALNGDGPRPHDGAPLALPPKPREPSVLDYPNTLSEGTSVRGDLKGKGGFRIDGHVDGSVESEGPVTIGDNGSVSGFVRGGNVTVYGAITGDVLASGHLEVGPRGRLLGDATARSVRVADGGVLCGMSRMGAQDAMGAAGGAMSADAMIIESEPVVSHERWLAGEPHVDVTAEERSA